MRDDIRSGSQAANATMRLSGTTPSSWEGSSDVTLSIKETESAWSQHDSTTANSSHGRLMRRSRLLISDRIRKEHRERGAPKTQSLKDTGKCLDFDIFELDVAVFHVLDEAELRHGTKSACGKTNADVTVEFADIDALGPCWSCCARGKLCGQREGTYR